VYFSAFSDCRAFTTLAYSPDGTYLLAAGQSKTVCYYHATRQVLLAKYEITQNKSLDGMDVSLVQLIINYPMYIDVDA